MGSRDQALTLERDGPPFGPPKDRPCELDPRARRGLARDDELGRHGHATLEVAQRYVEALDHLLRNPRSAVLEAVPGVRVRRQLRRDDEQLALEAEDQLPERPE